MSRILHYLSMRESNRYELISPVESKESPRDIANGRTLRRYSLLVFILALVSVMTTAISVYVLLKTMTVPGELVSPVPVCESAIRYPWRL